jgi:hypothetical protein
VRFAFRPYRLSVDAGGAGFVASRIRAGAGMTTISCVRVGASGPTG